MIEDVLEKREHADRGQNLKPFDSENAQSAARPTRRDEIVAAMIRVIERDGMTAATMRGVARELGFTTGVISHHFRDKRELLHAVLESIFEPWEAAIEAAGEAEDRWKGIRDLFVNMLPVNEENAAMYRTWASMLQYLDKYEELKAYYRQRNGRLRDQVANLIHDAQKAGAVRPEIKADIKSDMLLALADGLGMASTGEPDRFDAQRLAQIMEAEILPMRP